MSSRASFYKIVILGDGGVGKTSLRKRYFGEKFKENYMMTIGADFAAKKVTTEDQKEFTLHFWDLAGQQRFKEVRSGYYKNSAAAMLVFDLSLPSSFENLPKWLTELDQNIKQSLKEIPMILVGNKVDLRGEPNIKIITQQQGHQYASELSDWLGKNIKYFETSALVGLNIESAFNHLISELEN